MNVSTSHVRVVLVFSAHEPVCGARRLSASPLGRLVAVAEALGAPVGLAVSNELCHQLQRDLPETFAELKRGYASGVVRPIYTPAHHTPAELLSPAELSDELRLNEECVHGLLDAPMPARRGVLFTGCAIEGRLVAAVEERGIDFTLCPPFDMSQTTVSDAHWDFAHQPFRVGERLVALPVEPMALPADFEAAVVALREALMEAPAGATLTFVHALSELELVRWAWARLVEEAPRPFAFAAADLLLESDEVTPPWLPQVTFRRASPDATPAEMLQLWEGGRFVTTTLEWLVESFGFPRTPPVSAQVLFEEDYQLDRLPPRVQVPMRLRLVKAACQLGLDAENALSKRPYLDGYRLCQALDLECRLPDTRPQAGSALAASALSGLARMTEMIVDPRVAYRQVEIERLRDERGHDAANGFAELDGARAARDRAVEEIGAAQGAYDDLARNQFRGRLRWRQLIGHVRDHLAAVCIALDHLERAAQPMPLAAEAAAAV